MTLRELEDELAVCGYRYARRSKDAHRIYTDGQGGLVVIAEKHGRYGFSRGQLRCIRAQMYRQRGPQHDTRAQQ